MAFRFDAVPDWRGYIPLVDVLARYQRRDLGHDLVAGLVLGVITIPQAIAYAFLAGLPPEAGLYASLLPMVVYAVLGSSRELIVGPVAITAIMVAATIGQYAGRYDVAPLTISAVLCLEAGLFLWLLRLSQMGGIVNMLSHPVVSGFVNAAVILIVVSQLPSFLGLDAGGAGAPAAVLGHLAMHLGAANPVAIAIGTLSLAVLWIVRRYGYYAALPFVRRMHRNHAVTRLGPVLVAVLAVAAVTLGDLDDRFALAVVGHVPPGLPGLRVPTFEARLWIALVPPAAMIALVAFVESYTVGTMLAVRKRRRLIANQELIALGGANLAAAFTGGYPVAGSFSRSSVNVSAGARTPVSALFCAAMVVLALLVLTPLFGALPHAALAAIIIASVVTLLDFRTLRRAWTFSRFDAVTHVATLLGVLLLTVERGLVIGVLLSIAFFVGRSSRPHIAVVGRVGTSEIFRNEARHDVQTVPQVTAVRIDENIYFANASAIERRLIQLARERGETHHLLLVLSAVNFIDTSGLEMLYRVNANFLRMGIRLHLSDVKGPVMDRLETTDFIEQLTGKVYFTTDRAMRELEHRA